MTIDRTPTQSPNKNMERAEMEQEIAQLRQQLQVAQQQAATLASGSGLPVQNRQTLPSLQDNLLPQDSVAMISPIRLPDFWKDTPELWFHHIEAQFSNRKISSDNSKYNYVITALDTESLRQVSDVIRQPPPTDKYSNLKEKLIHRFTESIEKQLHKLLTGLELGTKKPTEL